MEALAIRDGDPVTHAFVVETNSMAPEIPRGAHVLVEAGREPKDGNYVIFAPDDRPNLILRRYVSDGVTARLEAADARVQPIDAASGKVVAVVLRIEIDALAACRT